jgi:peptidoglycan/xylan/chitin deacetylase (PgdA/CDA1 family)
MAHFIKKIMAHSLKTIRYPFESSSRLSKSTVQAEPVEPSTPEMIFREYGRLAQQQGLNRLYVVLSFDCDTPEDIPAAETLHAWLSQRGVKATYAVPGAQLLQGADTYRRLIEAGAEFINHGARPHAEWREGRYWSMTFYNEMTVEEVVEDIQKGHEICRRVLGYFPVGFRAPPFGYYQSPEQREVLYSALGELGYVYSTSTLPAYGLKYGPVVRENGIMEISLSGSYVEPFTILDSWNNIVSPHEPVVQTLYADLFIQTVDKFLELGAPGVLNYYVDPAHVCQGSVFHQAVEHLLDRGVETLYFGDLLRIARN